MTVVTALPTFVYLLSVYYIPVSIRHLQDGNQRIYTYWHRRIRPLLLQTLLLPWQWKCVVSVLEDHRARLQSHNWEYRKHMRLIENSLTLSCCLTF